MAQSNNFYSDRGILLVNGNIIFEPADFNSIQFTLEGNFNVEDGMTTDGSMAGFTNKNRSATAAVVIKIPNNRALPNIFDMSLYQDNIVQLQILGVRNLATSDYTGNSLILTNAKLNNTGTSGYSRVGTAGTISLNFTSTDYVWSPV